VALAVHNKFVNTHTPLVTFSEDDTLPFLLRLSEYSWSETVLCIGGCGGRAGGGGEGAGEAEAGERGGGHGPDQFQAQAGHQTYLLPVP
jgi:hypothetical protein